MIVRDEERALERCLESAAPYVDQIVVVDTGSKDGTAQLAQRHGAELVHLPWQDDFASARNASLERARGEFVLVLDADEWIEGGPPPKQLRRTLRRNPAEAYTVRVTDRLDAGRQQSYSLVRLFRNRPEYRYEGAFHEQITPSIARHNAVDLVEPQVSGLNIGHDGYTHEQRQDKNKAQRNIDHLQRRVAQVPDDCASRYFLIRELLPLRNGRAVPGHHVRQALKHLQALQQSAKIGDTDTLSASLRLDLDRLHVAALLAEGHARDALGALPALDPHPLPFLLLRADAELALYDGSAVQGKVLEMTLQHMQAQVDEPVASDLPVAEPHLQQSVLKSRIAELLLALDRIAEAQVWIAQAMTHASGGAEVSWVAAAIERRQGEPTAAMRAYLQGLSCDPYDPWCWVGLGETVLLHGPPGDAVDALAKAVALAPGWSDAEEALVAALLLAERESELTDFLGHDNSGISAAALTWLSSPNPGALAEPPEGELQPMLRRILRRVASRGRGDLLKRFVS